MTYWIFVINNTDAVFAERMDHRSWPIFNATPHRMDLKSGDCVVFYKAGRDGQKFLGTAKIASELRTERGKITGSVDLADIATWKKSPGIKEMIADLDFIFNKRMWGASLQGGVIRIPESDFLKILKRAES